ncbi:hypothetical protein ECE50_004430 [Chitinophaga sp. Mgbs1]|uniref:Uncharacterized protein n=1 Tax=Chitinophaga solisilvae TaxID=1233460 RepID=A0A433WPG3_9BACT|nr:hypothetical protein [Chitinophaga solisilvae]
MILNKTIAPTEGEISIKSYFCTSFNSFLFGIKANGFLEVTNKRLLFQAMGSGITRTPSVIHSEVPISEVVGINIYKGKAFNLLRLIAGVLIFVITAMLAGFLLTFLLSALDNSPVFYQFIIWVLFLASLFLAYFYHQQPGLDEDSRGLDAKDNSLQELLIVAAGTGALISMAKGAMSYSPYGSAKIALPVIFLTFLYALYRYSKKPAFSLMVHSKSGSNAIVKITGPSPMGAANSVASKALSARPAKDSILVLKELGALVLDIQNLGEYGIEKWRVK